MYAPECTICSQIAVPDYIEMIRQATLIATEMMKKSHRPVRIFVQERPESGSLTLSIVRPATRRAHSAIAIDTCFRVEGGWKHVRIIPSDTRSRRAASLILRLLDGYGDDIGISIPYPSIIRETHPNDTLALHFEFPVHP